MQDPVVVITDGDLRGRIGALSAALKTVLDTSTYAERLETADDIGFLAVLLRAVLEYGLPPVEDVSYLQLVGAVTTLEPGVHACADARTKAQRHEAIGTLRSAIGFTRKALEAVTVHIQRATADRLDRSDLLGRSYADALASAAQHIGQRVATLEQAISSARAAEEARQGNYETLKSDLEMRNKQDTEGVSSLREKLNQSYTSAIGEVEELRRGVAMDQIVSEAARQEKREQSAYVFWQIGAVVLALAGVGLVAWSGRRGVPVLEPGDIYRHLFIFFAVSGVSAYCARQAKIHRSAVEKLGAEHRALKGGGYFLATRDEMGSKTKEALAAFIAFEQFAHQRSDDGPGTEDPARSPQDDAGIVELAQRLLGLIEQVSARTDAAHRAGGRDDKTDDGERAAPRPGRRE